MTRLAFGIGLIAFNTLMVEILLTRVFDVIMYPNVGYMIITGALFAFGVAGIYATLKPLPSLDVVPDRLRWCSLGMAGSLLVIRPALNAIPFHLGQIAQQPLFQLACFLAMYLLITVPFFLAGLIFVRAFEAYARRIQTLYCWDLAGAAVGSVALIPLLLPIGPGGALLWAASIGLVASVAFVPWRRKSLVPLGFAAALVMTPVLLPEYLDFVEHKMDRGLRVAREENRSELVRWDPISKVEVIDLGSVKNIVYDGGSQGSFIYPFDGDYERLRSGLELAARENVEGGFLRHFWQRGVVASHWMRAGSARRVLVIGSAAGQEIRAALAFGAGHVDAVELVEEVIALGRNEYRHYNGGVLNHFQVNAVHGEGRAFLRAADQLYDIIQIFSNHSSSSVAAGAGAMDPTYLLTAEAFEEYFVGLRDDGILHINHHVYPRIVTTAALGWQRLGRTDFQRHVVVVMRYPIEIDTLPTVLIKMTPWTEAEMERLRALYSIRPGEEQYYEIVEDPLDREGSYLAPDFYSGALPAELVARVGYRITPTTDDRPYFKFFRRHLRRVEPDDENFVRVEIAQLLNTQIDQGGGIPMDVAHLVVAGVTALAFAAGFVGIPLVFSRVGREPWPGKASTLVYFSCLGAGFIMLELTFIQRFWKFIGYPLYTYAIVLFTLLLAAGLGSLSSERLRVVPAGRWWLPFAGTVSYGLFFLVVHEWMLDLTMGLPIGWRALIAATSLVPIGFFMGMAFPLGILSVEGRSRGAVAWAWGMNGLFTVVGGLASVLLSIYFGFTVTELLAMGLYVAAFAALSRIVPPRSAEA